VIDFRARPTYIHLVVRWDHVLLSFVAAALLVASNETFDVDPDGVALLFPSAPNGSSFRLGTQNPNNTANFAIERASASVAEVATAGMDGAFHYWNLLSHPLTYASGGSGFTSRLHMYASGGQQLYTWKTQNGYLSSPADVRNQEVTAYVRIHGILDAPRVAINLKIRGGAHTSSNPDLASCSMMAFQAASKPVRYSKELIHPQYDGVQLAPLFQVALTEGQWYGLKLVSYSVPGDASRVVNRLYVDTDPIDFATGTPKNDWRLLSEYVDVEGQKVNPAGQYTKLVDWGGWMTTVRTDGIHDVDFALVSVREIVPPHPRRRSARP
jgi:hypothetical protein